MMSSLTPHVFWEIRQRTTIVLIIFSSVLVYSSSLYGPFLYDDNVVIVGNPIVRDFDIQFFRNRAVVDFTFAVNWFLGGSDTFWFHLTNVFFHASSGIVCFFLVKKIISTTCKSGYHLSAEGKIISSLTALFFIVHPVQSQAVSYIAQRYAVVSALFFMLALLLYFLARESSGIRSFILLSGFVFCAALAFKSKENSAILPLMVFLVEFAFFGWGWKKFAGACLLILLVVTTVTLTYVSGPFSLDSIAIGMRSGTEMSRYDYFMTQLGVVFSYFKLLFFPFELNVDHDYPVYSSSQLFVSVLYFLFHLSVFATGVYAFARGILRKSGHFLIFGFGIFWFYLTISVESSFIPIVDVMNEHRLYLPSVGLFLSGVVFFEKVVSYRFRAWGGWGILVLLLMLGGGCYLRNGVWQSPFLLWGDAVAKSPNKARPLNNLGVAYFEEGDYDAALKYYLRAIGADRNYIKAYYNAGEVFQKKGDLANALVYYGFFVKRVPGYPEVYKNLSDIYRAYGDRAKSDYNLKLYLSLSGRPLPPHLR